MKDTLQTYYDKNNGRLPVDPIPEEAKKSEAQSKLFKRLDNDKGMRFETPCPKCNTHYTGAGMICKQCNEFMGYAK